MQYTDVQKLGGGSRRKQEKHNGKLALATYLHSCANY